MQAHPRFKDGRSALRQPGASLVSRPRSPPRPSEPSKPDGETTRPQAPHLASSERLETVRRLTPLESAAFGRAPVDSERVVLCFDVDAFYVQVEEVEDASVRGRPVAVTQKNIVVTSNYEARAYGVTKLMFIADALRACPHLCLRSGEDLTRYRAASSAILAAIRSPARPVATGSGAGASRALDRSDQPEELPWTREALASALLQAVFPAAAVIPDAAMERLGLDEFFVDVSVYVDALLCPGSREFSAWKAAAAADARSAAAGVPDVAAVARALRPGCVVHPDGSQALDAGARRLAHRLLPGPGAAPPPQAAPTWTCAPPTTGSDWPESPTSDEASSDDAWGGLGISQPCPESGSPTAHRPGAREEDSPVAERLCLGAALALAIRRRIRAATGYTVSAGVGCSRLAAKLAVNVRKPNDQSALPPGGVRPFLWTLPLGRLPGIGSRARRTLRDSLDAPTLPRALLLSRAALAAALGPHHGSIVHDVIRGLDPAPLRGLAPPLTVTVEDSFKECSSREAVAGYFVSLARALVPRAAADRAMHGRVPGALTLKFREAGNRAKTRRVGCPSAVVAAAAIFACDEAASSRSQEAEAALRAAEAAVTQTCVPLVMREARTPLHLTLLGLGLAGFTSLDGHQGASEPSTKRRR